MFNVLIKLEKRKLDRNVFYNIYQAISVYAVAFLTQRDSKTLQFIALYIFTSPILADLKRDIGNES